MSWYNEAIFYHIYPLGMTNAPKKNNYGEVVHRLNTLLPWISHIKEIGCNAIYIGPLFESVGHGYETTDYKKVDCRLGNNDDLRSFVSRCHLNHIRVILDGVFNHVGRDFFAFQDLKKNRENSKYKDWFCKVNFNSNNSYNDHLSYENWGGHDLLVKLNQKNPEVIHYICDVIRYWVNEFDIDGIRLDAADVLDFDFMKELRKVADEVKEDFWLMGEVIHGNYANWVNDKTLHSVTNYVLHKALYSSHNEQNYFELAHSIKYVGEMVKNQKLYSFVDNHDVERIYTKLKNKAHFIPVHILLYTLPGIPSIYYGSEFGIEGKKERHSDDSLRPSLNYDDYKDIIHSNPYSKLIKILASIRDYSLCLKYGEYKELVLNNTYFVFSRTLKDKSVIICVNCGSDDVSLNIECKGKEYIGALSNQKVLVNNQHIQVCIKSNSGEIFIPSELYNQSEHLDLTEINDMTKEVEIEGHEIQPSNKENKVIDLNKPYEEMSIEELQEAILEKMRRNGPVTEYMLGTVRENVYRESLITWVKSFLF